MKKEFIPYELALRMRQLGFDIPTFGYYQSTRLKLQFPLLKSETQTQTYMREEDCSAPTFQQAFRWFREKYGLASQFSYYHVPKWGFEILEFTDIKMTPSKIVVEYSKPRTYEEAELACLEKLIEIVEQSKSE